MVEIIPAILAKTPEEFREAVRKLEPYAERVHLDIIDGIFAPNTTVQGFKELGELETPLAFDVHLMVQRPADILGEWLKTKADRFVVHVESEGDLKELARTIRGQGKQMGLALNPETAGQRAEPYLDLVHLVQFMTVHPGFQGEEFLPEVLDKIKWFYQHHGHTPIAVDGGITPETAADVAKAGATILVAGSYIMSSADPAKAIEELKNSSSS